MSIIKQLQQIQQQAEKFHDPQIIMVQLDRLAKQNGEIQQDFNEALATYGAEKRSHALRDIADTVARALYNLDSGYEVAYNSKLIQRDKVRFDYLATHFKYQRYAGYDLSFAHFYGKLTYSTAIKIWQDVYTDVDNSGD